MISLPNTGLYLAAAVMLLGSPGPGIAALLAMGKRRGFVRSLGFYAWLQAGLALVAGASALGLASLLKAFPAVSEGLRYGALAYLVWLAWRIGSAPVGDKAQAAAPLAAWGGFVLGVTNPKAYLAMASLMGAWTLAPGRPWADAGLKWALCVVVILVVDIAWLWVGAVIGRAALKPPAERALNLAMGGVIVAAAVMAFAG